MRRRTAGRRARALPAVLTGCLAGLMGAALAGCHTASAASPATSPAKPASAPATTASASPGFSVPGTHKSTAVYRISSRISTLVVLSHAGDVSVTGVSGPVTSVTQQADYSSTPPVTVRAVRGTTLTVTYTCPVQLVCGVGYVIQVPRHVAVQVTAAAGAIRLAGLAGSVTAKADVGLISATGLTGAAVRLTTGVGGISAAFTAAPSIVAALTRVGAITLRVPDTATYKVIADARLGKATVGVPQSSSAAHVISATTDVGAILIGPPA
jgi:hypothetical protein